MYAEEDPKNSIMILLVAITIISFSTYIFVMEQTSPIGNIVAQGGYISNVSFNQSENTTRWSFVYGSFDESINVDDIEVIPSGIQRVNVSSYGYDDSMVVIASMSSLNLLDIVQALPSSIDAYLGVGSAIIDSGTSTFKTLYNISFGNVTRELYGVKTNANNGTYITAAFLSNGSLNFVATTTNGSGFDNTSTFFQFLLPVNGAQNYSFSVVSNVSCPSYFFIEGTLASDNESVDLNWTTIPGTMHSSVYYLNESNATNYLEFTSSNSINTTLSTYSELPVHNKRFYEVSSYLPAYKCVSSNRVGMYRLNLTPSGNLMSFPFDFVNDSIEEVFRPILPSIPSINEYNNSGQTYNFFIQFMGSIFKNFNTIEVGQAYWVTINESVNYTIIGSLNNSLNKELYNYSSLIGFPFVEGNNSVPYVLRSIDGNYSTLNEYDNIAKSYNFYIIFGGSVFSNFDNITPTLGYWILSNETQTLTLP